MVHQNEPKDSMYNDFIYIYLKSKSRTSKIHNGKTYHELRFSLEASCQLLLAFIFVLWFMGKNAFWATLGFWAAVPRVATGKKIC